MISIFGDESSDSRNQHVYAVAALQGPKETWDELRSSWSNRLDGKVFHSADCESGYGDFRGMPSEERANLHRDLTSTLADSGLIGWGIAIDLKGSRLAFPDSRPEHNACSCFFRTMIFHVEKAHADYPSQPIEIAFDRNTKTEHNSRLLFQYLAEESDPGNGHWLPSGPEFVTREEVGVQAADLWVRELMKFLDGTLFSPDYKPREQWDILLRTKRFGADLQFGSYFQSMKDQMATLEEKTGMTKDRYIAWLQKKRRQDNQSNRIEYMRDIAARDRSRMKSQDAGTITSPDAAKRRRFGGHHLCAPANDTSDIDRAKTRIIFDTSGLNKLKKDPNQQAVLEKLRNSHEVLISETSIVELSATKDSENRRQLVDVCERLLPFGHCLMPHNWIAEEMPRLNTRYKDRFCWDDVDIAAPMIQEEILQRQFLNQDRMGEESRQYAKENNKRFVGIFQEARDKFGLDFPDNIKDLTLKQFVDIYKADGGPFWKTVASWYKRARLIDLDEVGAREFIGKCPPFHALVMGSVIAHYQYGIPRGVERTELEAGRNDLFMAVYLPYCDVFITDDIGQQNALREIAKEVGLDVRIVGYPEFRNALLNGGVETGTA